MESPLDPTVSADSDLWSQVTITLRSLPVLGLYRLERSATKAVLISVKEIGVLYRNWEFQLGQSCQPSHRSKPDPAMVPFVWLST